VPRSRRPQHLVMISVVAERYGIHPQTLRMYEREGLLKPARSEGNTRLYDTAAIERLETILNLTRDLGVNLAGVEVILNMRDRLAEMQAEVERLVQHVHEQARDRRAGIERQHALVKIEGGALVKR
jgi:MerR family transcriptional regulator/heat shock protein HspR